MLSTEVAKGNERVKMNLTSLPDAVQDKEKLDEDTAEWEDSAHHDAREGTSVE